MMLVNPIHKYERVAVVVDSAVSSSGNGAKAMLPASNRGKVLLSSTVPVRCCSRYDIVGILIALAMSIGGSRQRAVLSAVRRRMEAGEAQAHLKVNAWAKAWRHCNTLNEYDYDWHEDGIVYETT